jgi:hypothetical protein
MKGDKVDKQVKEAVKTYLDALTVKERAEEAHDEARQVMLDILASHGLDEVALDEVTVKVSPAERRSWNLEKLREAVSPALFRKVTKPTVDTKAWDSSVERGEISAKVIRTCVEISHSVRVLVRPTKGAEKPKAVKTTKKATA